MADPTDGSTGQGLADLFGGVNRPQLNSFVATSQARNGLVSAQTQDAMIKAAQAQEAMEARGRIHADLVSNGAPESEAQLMTDAMVGSANNDPVTAMKLLQQAKLMYGGPQSQVQGQQGFEGKIAGPVAQPVDSMMPVNASAQGSALGPTVVSPTGQADIGAKNAQAGAANALAGLNTHKNIDPAAFRAQTFGQTSPDGQAALTQAVAEGRLDPTRLNARSAPILAQIELGAPGTNFNRLHADAALQANSTFQQRAMSVDMLPGLLSNVTSLGKKLNGGTGYNDLKAVGTMQQWMNGQVNDPDYTEYMTARNDTLLRLAGVMRGVGMSDQAHTAEVQAMAPTLSPAGLDAWLKGQMSVVTPMLQRQNRITHLGEAGQGTAPLVPAGPAASPVAPPAGPPPLGSTVPTPGGGPTPGALPSYPNEAAALAAGHKKGDRVQIGGVSGTLQ